MKESSLHLGLLLHGSLDRLTGGFLYDRQLVAHLQRRGHRVSVIELPGRGWARSLLDNVSPRLRRRLRGGGFDLLLQDELAHPSCFALNRRLRSLAPAGAGRLPVVAIVHLLRVSQRWPAWQRPLYRVVERRYLASVSGWVVVNPRLAERVRRLAGVERPLVVAVPGGDHLAVVLGPREIVARAHAPGPLVALFVGNLTPLKNLELVLEAMSRCDAVALRLEVIGSLEVDRRYVRRLRRRIAETGLGPRVVLHGELPPREVAARMAGSHLLVMPSAPESYSIVYLEAMGHGLPVIASSASDSASLIEPESNGFRVAPGDAAALAGQLRLLATDRGRLAAMSLAARRCHERHPTWEQSMERVHELLRALHAGGGRSGGAATTGGAAQAR